MKLTDICKLQEQIAINRHAGPGGIVSVHESIVLPVEFKVSRWASQSDWSCGALPYQVTRDGGASLGLALLTNTGGDILWKGVRGDSLTGRNLNNANAKLVVANVTGTPNATDTNTTLTASGAEIGRKAMDTSFPLIPGETAGGVTAAVRQLVLRSTFGSSDANGDWRRFWILIDEATDEIFDNFSSNQGTKVSGQVWELTVSMTIT